MNFTRSLTFKTLLPLLIILCLMISIFGFYLSTTTKNKSKEFLIESILMPEFKSLGAEKDLEFKHIKDLTEFTAQKIEDKVQDSKKRTSEETDRLFNQYISKKPDGSYRSERDESEGRYQMAAFFNNKIQPDARHKGIFVDAFLYFDPFAHGHLPFVFTTYFASKDSIWQYGFPDWALESPAEETFDKYGWFYEADPVHNPNKEHSWTDMYYDEFQDQWMISSLMPIYDGEEFLGIVGQDFILQRIIETTKEGAVGKSGLLFFIDNLNNIVAHPDTANVINKKGTNDQRLDLKTIPDKPLTKALQSIEANKQGYVFTEEDNRRIVVYFPLKSVDWKIIYVVNEDELLKIADETNNEYIFAFIIFATLVIILIILLVRFIMSNPIKELTKATCEISKGNLNKKIDIKSKDEIGELADSFNKMTIDLKESRKKLEGYAADLENQVKARTEELEIERISLGKKVHERTAELEKLKTELEQIVAEKTKTLRDKLTELERMNKLMVGRELKMVELKKEVEELKKRLGQA